MTDTQKQALQRFGAALFAAIIGVVVAALQNPKFAELVGEFFGGDALITGLILAAVGPLVLALGKLAAGATQKAPTVTDSAVRGGKKTRIVEGESPGLFG